jgi:bla regulator protein blaR1
MRTALCMSYRSTRGLKPPLYGFIVACALGLSATAAAQEIATTTGATFDTASVKPSPPPEPNPFGFPVGATIRFLPGRLTATQATLRDLIRRAYDVQDVRIVGGPDWMASDRFDVVAASEGRGSVDQLQTMLRSLLLDRFALRTHIETRDVPVYHLVTARRDGSTGAQLRPSRVDCAALRLKRGPGGTAPADGSEPECQVSFRLSGGSMTISFKGETTSELARRVIPERDRPVVDKTGLSGTFDGELTFAPEPLPGFPRLPGSENGVSVFTALQEQWGLKLEPERGPVGILVIESAQKPTAN